MKQNNVLMKMCALLIKTNRTLNLSSKDTDIYLNGYLVNKKSYKKVVEDTASDELFYLDKDTLKIILALIVVTGSVTPILLTKESPLMFINYGERNVTLVISVCRKYYDISVHTEEEGFKIIRVRVTVGEIPAYTEKNYHAYFIAKLMHNVIENIDNNKSISHLMYY